jgi:hypothetical protein
MLRAATGGPASLFENRPDDDDSRIVGGRRGLMDGWRWDPTSFVWLVSDRFRKKIAFLTVFYPTGSFWRDLGFAYLTHDH